MLMDNIILYSTKKEAIREMIHSFFISMGKFGVKMCIQYGNNMVMYNTSLRRGEIRARGIGLTKRVIKQFIYFNVSRRRRGKF